MKYSVSLKKNYEFRRLYSKGKCAVNPFLVVYYRKYRKDGNRIGISVSGKLGKAVQRNRVRRRLREIYRLNEEKLQTGLDVIIVARVRSNNAEYIQLERAYLDACKKLGILKGSGNVGQQ